MTVKQNTTRITQHEMDTGIAMARLDTRLTQLETMQERQFGKIDTLVDEMKLVVKEITSAHSAHIDQGYVTKDLFYQRDEENKKDFEHTINILGTRLTTEITEQGERQQAREALLTEQLTALKIRIAQIVTGLMVVWGGIQLYLGT